MGDFLDGILGRRLLTLIIKVMLPKIVGNGHKKGQETGPSIALSFLSFFGCLLSEKEIPFHIVLVVFF